MFNDLTMEILLISFFVISSVLLIMVFLLYRMKLKERKYDYEKKKAELDEMREFFETKIYNLNEKLLSNESRWKDVNHLLISSQNKFDNKKVNQVQITNFLKNSGITQKDLKIEKDLVFVLTPFHENKSSTYDKINEICTDVGLKCYRGDEEYIEEDIMSHILKYIVKSRIIIANINGRNPNVFYELGIAHALDKPTIIIAKNLDEVPFDIKSKNIILYNNLNELHKKLKSYLLKTLIQK